MVMSNIYWPVVIKRLLLHNDIAAINRGAHTLCADSIG
jgi:hypothetical protein